MQVQYDPFAIGRRALDIEDYIDIARRHKAWIFGPLFAAVVTSVVVAFLWPDTFISTAVIRVVPPQVPERYVPTNVNMEMSQRINSMAQTITSRATLTNLIQTYGLYPRDVRRKPVEDVIEQMRKKDIRIGLAMTQQSATRAVVFPVSFAYEDRIVAQRVTADLVGRFIAENTRERSNVSIMTTEFLKDQLDQAKTELDAIEVKLTEFRVRNIGRLPDERAANLQSLYSLENRMSHLNAAASRINQDKLLIESQLRVAKDQLNTLVAASKTEPSLVNERLEKLDREIQGLDQALANLREHYKDTHPDVRRVEGQLQVSRRTREDLISQEEAKKTGEPSAPRRVPVALTRDILGLEGAVSKLEAQAKAKDVEMDDLNREIGVVDKAIKNYQDRIQASPLGEQQYAELIRDYELAKKQYAEFQSKRAMSATATDLENRKQGETLELLDPASLPEEPTEPTRWIIITIGAGLGVILGIFLAGAREMKDTSLKNLKDVRAYTQLLVLGSIPLLENDLVVRRRRRLAWLGWSTALLVGALIMSGSVYFYYSTRV